MMVKCTECGTEFDFQSDAIICAMGDAKRAELRSLRDENQRLRAAFQEILEGVGGWGPEAKWMRDVLENALGGE